jgi:hypothetical protein
MVNSPKMTIKNAIQIEGERDTSREDLHKEPEATVSPFVQTVSDDEEMNS